MSDVDETVRVLARGLEMLAPVTDRASENERRFTGLLKLKAKIEFLLTTYEHAADELGD